MTRKTAATLAAGGVAVAGLMVLAIMFGALNWIFPTKPDYTQWPGQVRIELMPPDSPEYLERHYPGPNGKDVKTEIVYRNGDTGLKIYRADNTLEVWTIEFKDGGTRLRAQYAKDGRQVVLGYEFRDDRTLKWKSTNDGTLVTTTTYYFDGTSVFSVVGQKIGEDVLDAQYFRKSGKPWLHQIASKYNATNPRLEEVWDNDGNRVYVREMSQDSSFTTVTYFRPDGTAAYRQTWGQYTYSYPGYDGYPGGMYDDGHYSSTSTVLKVVEVFGADGKTVVRLIRNTDDGTKIATVTDTDSTGASVAYTLTDNEVTHVDKKDKDGRVIDSSDPRPGQVKLELGEELTKPFPTAPKPVPFWEEQEKDPSKRGDDAP
jgi:hypothetical protein